MINDSTTITWFNTPRVQSSWQILKAMTFILW